MSMTPHDREVMRRVAQALGGDAIVELVASADFYPAPKLRRIARGWRGKSRRKLLAHAARKGCNDAVHVW